jgi:hypothetical protein
MRQDSTFLYYFGQHRDGLVGVIDIDNDEEILFGDDIDIEDIVWMGFVPSVADLAAEVGITKTAPMKDLEKMVNGQWPISTSCLLTASIRRFRSWIFWASIPTNRRKRPHFL